MTLHLSAKEANALIARHTLIEGKSVGEALKEPTLFAKHDQATVTIRLPLPPSMNHYWRSFVPKGGKRAITHVSTDGKQFQRDVEAAWLAHHRCKPPAMTGSIRLSVIIYAKDRRKIDLDNRLKPLQDALAKCGAFGDDNQIDELRVTRGAITPPDGACDVLIETIGE